MNDDVTGSFVRGNYKIEKFKLKTKNFIETGTYKGDGVQLAIESGFENIFSIELNQELHDHSKTRFADVDFVKLCLGDSTDVLPVILEENKDLNFTFWLDGHDSGGHTSRGYKSTPLLEELECILSRDKVGEIIYIDDMRTYNNFDEEVNEKNIFDLVKRLKPNATLNYIPSIFNPQDVLVIEY